MSTKYAIVNVFGRQMKVSEGDTITANYMSAAVGEKVAFPEVLLVNTGSDLKVGAPTLEGARVIATIEKHTRGEKILIMKYLNKNKLKKTQGHRQPFTVLKINTIEA